MQPETDVVTENEPLEFEAERVVGLFADLRDLARCYARLDGIDNPVLHFGQFGVHVPLPWGGLPP